MNKKYSRLIVQYKMAKPGGYTVVYNVYHLDFFKKLCTVSFSQIKLKHILSSVYRSPIVYTLCFFFTTTALLNLQIF